jgi:multiple sugar transport system permease protein
MKPAALLLIIASLSGVCRAEMPALVMWGPGVERTRDTAGFDAEVAVFEHRHHCRVQRLDMGAGHMDAQKLSTAIAGNVPPDLVRQGRFNIGDFASRDAFQPLDDLIARDAGAPNAIRKRDFYEAAWNEATYNGRVYGIPDSVDDRALYYNRAAFRRAGLDPNKPPRTWTELRSMAAKMTRFDSNGNINQVGYLPNYGNVWFYMYAWQNDGEFLSRDGRRCTMEDPQNVQALAYMASLYRVMGGLSKVDEFSSGFRAGTLDPFLTGQVAMKVDGNWSLDTILRYAPGLDFGVAPAPVPDDRYRHTGRFRKEETWVTWCGGFSWVIPRGVSGKARDLAWEFVKWDNSLEAQRIRYTVQRAEYAKIGRKMVPEMRANRVVNEALLRDFTPRTPRVVSATRVFMHLMPHARFRPVTFVGQKLWDEQVRAMDRAARGTDPATALRMSAHAVQNELDKSFARTRRPVIPQWAYWVLGAFAAIVILVWSGWVLVRVKSLGRNARSEALAGYAFSAPWIIGFVVFTLGPILASILLSFCDYDVLHAPRWVGLLNYTQLVSASGDGPLLLKSLKNVLFMSVVGIPLTMVAGLAIALLLNARVKGMHWYRTAFYLPAITPVVAGAILWVWLLNPQYGLIDVAWTSTLTRWFGVAAPNWLADEAWAKPAYILLGLWGAGGGMILWLAGLQGVPKHLYEAAELDGAGPWRKFLNVTLPLLTPTIFFLAVMGAIGAIQIFEVAYIMRGDGPLGYPNDATMMPVVLLFQNAFTYFKMGYASALAWMLFVVILGITLMQLRLGKRWVHYGE